MSIHSAAILDRKFIEMLKLLNVYLNHFPRHEKYALCNHIRNTAYHLYDLITETQKRYHKKTTLTEMDITHEQLRMQIRLAFELGYFKFKDGKIYQDSVEQEVHRIVTLQSLVDEIGRMIGGWIIHERSQEKGNALKCA
jgi:hypothetical protein